MRSPFSSARFLILARLTSFIICIHSRFSFRISTPPLRWVSAKCREDLILVDSHYSWSISTLHSCGFQTRSHLKISYLRTLLVKIEFYVVLIDHITLTCNCLWNQQYSRKIGNLFLHRSNSDSGVWRIPRCFSSGHQRPNPSRDYRKILVLTYSGTVMSTPRWCQAAANRRARSSYKHGSCCQLRE